MNPGHIRLPSPLPPGLPGEHRRWSDKWAAMDLVHQVPDKRGFPAEAVAHRLQDVEPPRPLALHDAHHLALAACGRVDHSLVPEQAQLPVPEADLRVYGVREAKVVL